MKGFVQIQRGPDVEMLLKSPDAFALLTQIALRARRTTSLDFGVPSLKLGEAFIGDHKSIGLTERRYRTSKKRLEKAGLATFKGTSKGTVARLCDSRIFDINIEEGDEQKDEPKTNKRRASDELETTNKNDKNDKNEKKEERLPSFNGFISEEKLDCVTFRSPKLEEWLTQADEVGFPRRPAQQAWLSYQAKGWMMGRTKMRNWKSALASCKLRHEEWEAEKPVRGQSKPLVIGWD